MDKVKIQAVHISTIGAGDTIVHYGKLTTVCANNIQRDTFIGITLFGDSYHLGYKPVNKVVGWIGKTGNVIPIR